MINYSLTKKAVEDLNSIWGYTFNNWSEKRADRYYAMLLNNCQEIAENPGLGRAYDEISTGLFGIKASRHIIFYRKSLENSIEITRILHERMDLKMRLG